MGVTRSELEIQNQIAAIRGKYEKQIRNKHIQAISVELMDVSRAGEKSLEEKEWQGVSTATCSRIKNGKTVQLDSLIRFTEALIEAIQRSDVKNTKDVSVLDELLDALAVPNPSQNPCPYKGLLSFKEKDVDYFFGRESFSEEVVEAFETHPFICIVGSSGSGKSSVARAGVCPLLKKKGNRIFEFVPSKDLCKGFVLFLEHALNVEHADEGSTQARFENVLEKLGAHSQQGAVIVVDQFERVFVECDETEQRVFSQMLVHLTKATKVRLLLTMRADFFADAISLDEDFSELLTQGLRNLGGLSKSALKDVMIQPAAKVGLQFEAGLAERMLESVLDAPGGLPLLEFTLEELWQNREGRWLTHHAYDDIGQVRGALQNHANRSLREIQDDSLVDEEQIQNLFLRMVRISSPGEGSRETGRRVYFSTLSEHERTLVEKLADKRLLVVSKDRSQGSKWAEIAHESLIRHWDRFRGWIESNRKLLERKEELHQIAMHWEKQKDSVLLPISAQLAHYSGEDFSPKLRYRFLETITAGSKIFLEEAQKKDQAERTKNEKREKKQRRILETAFGVSLVLLLISTLAGFMATEKKEEAENARLIALAKSIQSEDPLTSSLMLASLQTDDPPMSAWRLGFDLLATWVPQLKIGNGKSAFLDAAFSPDEKWIALCQNDGSVLIHSVSSKEHFVLKQPSKRIRQIQWSNDSINIFVISDDSMLRVWNFPQRKIVQAVELHVGIPFVMDVSNEKKVLVGGEKGAVQIIRNDGTTKKIHVGDAHLQKLSWSHDGHSFFALNALGSVFVGKDDAEQSFAETLLRDKKYFKDAFWVPNQNRLLVISLEGEVQVWDALQKEKLVGFQTQTVPQAVSLDSKNQKIFLATTNGLIQQWSLKGIREKLWRLNRVVEQISLSPDGNTLVAVTSENGVQRIGVHDPQTSFSELQKHMGWVHQPVFSAKNNQVLTFSDDGFAYLYHLETAQPLKAQYLLPGEIVASHVFNTGSELLKYPLSVLSQSRVLVAKFHFTTNQWIAATQDGEVFVFSENGALSFREKFSETPIRKIEVFEKRSLVAFAADDGAVALLDLSKQRLEVLGQHQRPIQTLTFDVEGNRIVTGSDDGTVRVWSVDTKQQVASFKSPSGPVLSADFHPNPRWIVFGAWDDTLQLWDTQNSESTIEIARFQSSLKKIWVDPKDQTAWLVTRDGEYFNLPIGWNSLSEHLEQRSLECLSVEQRMHLLGESSRVAKEREESCKNKSLAFQPNNPVSIPHEGIALQRGVCKQIDHLHQPLAHKEYKPFRDEHVLAASGFGLYFPDATANLFYDATERALALDYEFPHPDMGEHWMSLRRLVDSGPLDLSVCQGLSFLIRTSKPGPIRITISDEGAKLNEDEMWWFESEIKAPNQWIQLEAPFNKFAPAYGFGARNQDVSLNPQKVVAYEINIVTPKRVKGTLELKEVSAFK